MHTWVTQYIYTYYPGSQRHRAERELTSLGPRNKAGQEELCSMNTNTNTNECYGGALKTRKSKHSRLQTNKLLPPPLCRGYSCTKISMHMRPSDLNHSGALTSHRLTNRLLAGSGQPRRLQGLNLG